MNPISIAIAGVLFVVGLFVGRNTPSPVLGTQTSTPTQESQISETPSPSPEPSIPASITPTLTSTPTQPTSSPTATPRNIQPTEATRKSQSPELISFQYPNAEITSSSKHTINLSSTDDAGTITSWYEQKLRELGYGSRSAAKTNNNGNIENRLGAAKYGSKVEISIKKTPTSNKVTITVSISESENNDIKIEIKNSQSI